MTVESLTPSRIGAICSSGSLAAVAAVWVAGTVSGENGSAVRARASSETVSSFFTTNLCAMAFFREGYRTVGKVPSRVVAVKRSVHLLLHHSQGRLLQPCVGAQQTIESDLGNLFRYLFLREGPILAEPAR